MRPSLTVRAIGTLAAIAVAAAFALPLLWVFTSSLRPGNTFVEYLNPITWESLIPINGQWDNYVGLLQSSFVTALGNSFFVGGATVVLGLVVSALAAFALSMFDFPFKNAVFIFVVACFLIPFDAIAIPLAGQFRDWNLTDTYTGLILPALANGFAIFVLRQFFLGIPRELYEAARVDGLGYTGILWRIYIPLSKPAMIGAGLMLFLSQWQAFVWPLLIGTSQEKQLAPIALANLKGLFTVDLGQILAGSFLLSVVPMILLLMFQKHYTASLAATGSKQ